MDFDLDFDLGLGLDRARVACPRALPPVPLPARVPLLEPLALVVARLLEEVA